MARSGLLVLLPCRASPPGIYHAHSAARSRAMVLLLRSASGRHDAVGLLHRAKPVAALDDRSRWSRKQRRRDALCRLLVGRRSDLPIAGKVKAHYLRIA